MANSKPPYAKVGNQFFAAYAGYRNGTLAARQQAAAEFGKLEGEMSGDKIKDLLASCWESIAVEQWRTGQGGAAAGSLKTAEKYANGDAKRRINMDRTALRRQADPGSLNARRESRQESLVNLGIVYDLIGWRRRAYDSGSALRHAASRTASPEVDRREETIHAQLCNPPLTILVLGGIADAQPHRRS